MRRRSAVVREIPIKNHIPDADVCYSNNKLSLDCAMQYILVVAANLSNLCLLERIMNAKLRIAAVATALSLTTLAAHAGEPVTSARVSRCATPHYPVSWQDDGIQGRVRVAVLVGADGSVQDAKVVESSGHRALDRASLRAGYHCTFAAPKAGDSAAVWTTVQYKWVMN
jgi:periplasmic protein TonB